MSQENLHKLCASPQKNLQGIMVFDSGLVEKATAFSREFDIPLLERCDLFREKNKTRMQFFKQRLSEDPERGFAFLLESEGLQLLDLSNGVSILVDFCHGKANHRRIYGGGTGQMIAKAVGLKGALRPRVLDATAGLGQDSFVLASLGCEVTMLERSEIVQGLLRDGLFRAHQGGESNPELAEVIARMRLLTCDAREFLLRSLTSDEGSPDEVFGPHEVLRPHVVYLDPMFPVRKKSAQVKKEMQSFHHIVGSDLDADELLAPARELALARVVVKRPKVAPFLADCEPDHQIMGKSSRYDLYINRALEKC
ncbi:class I SAM-dependent methyltransferase [Pseudoteredinibacter isoporae]|uniref:Ribosomal RNA small subunit methyltransferase J n=1 Tax=Pseudoteredinibacter isoporae TaxID=570281 RepID=A0A7X0MWS8_9GAMM|nr:class I SAM-dependent methyltransferase [Pseudoteredinibacter isoporae]MBB6522783.1 16S rRNA (guanine1516-N2)-methyltransferase [Pseudoteredinibacter isoporae]NHO88310.1 class I SAM-dependent methyltransferase [Pseudoteredinibacter isoporae]NIB23359.1 class I SAM-dependent methyltransferase [Pseudoteredinibacter isoporae]